MIISRCPLRISLIGGGSDIPEISAAIGGGASLGFSINWHMSLVGHSFMDKLVLKYSDIELVDNVSTIKHAIFREVLARNYPNISNYEITSMCDVIGGTGLGSSSAFTVALLNLIDRKLEKRRSTLNLAYTASIAEIEWVGSKIGLQDAFLCALGGVNLLRFNGKQRPIVEAIEYDDDYINKELSPFILFKIEGLHSSSNQLEEMPLKTLHFEEMKNLIPAGVKALKDNNIDELSLVVNAGWEIKKRVLKDTNIGELDLLFDSIKQLDPKAGGKLLGSGGGGFFLVISKNSKKIKEKFGDKAYGVQIDGRGAFVVES